MHLYRASSVPAQSGLSQPTPACLTCSPDTSSQGQLPYYARTKTASMFENSWRDDDDGDVQTSTEAPQPTPKKKKKGLEIIIIFFSIHNSIIVLI